VLNSIDEEYGPPNRRNGTPAGLRTSNHPVPAATVTITSKEGV
jgi:hypothetical protein